MKKFNFPTIKPKDEVTVIQEQTNDALAQLYNHTSKAIDDLRAGSVEQKVDTLAKEVTEAAKTIHKESQASIQKILDKRAQEAEAKASAVGAKAGEAAKQLVTNIARGTKGNSVTSAVGSFWKACGLPTPKKKETVTFEMPANIATLLSTMQPDKEAAE